MSQSATLEVSSIGTSKETIDTKLQIVESGNPRTASQGTLQAPNPGASQTTVSGIHIKVTNMKSYSKKFTSFRRRKDVGHKEIKLITLQIEILKLNIEIEGFRITKIEKNT